MCGLAGCLYAGRQPESGCHPANSSCTSSFFLLRPEQLRDSVLRRVPFLPCCGPSSPSAWVSCPWWPDYVVGKYGCFMQKLPVEFAENYLSGGSILGDGSGSRGADMATGGEQGEGMHLFSCWLEMLCIYLYLLLCLLLSSRTTGRFNWGPRGSLSSQPGQTSMG